MKRKIIAFAIAAAGSLVAIGAAKADTISVNSGGAGVGLYSTGVDDSGNAVNGGLSPAAGVADTHYSLTASPETLGTGAPFITQANGFPLPSPWQNFGGNPPPSAQWISPQANYQQTQGGPFISDANGEYDFTTHFADSFTGTGPTIGQAITGQLFVDNAIVDILLNGHALATTTYLSITGANNPTYQNGTGTDFQEYHGYNSNGAPLQFTIYAPTAFLQATNTLTFEVFNIPGGGGNPAGLDVAFSGATSTHVQNPTPLPAGVSGGIALVGLLGLGSIRKMRKSKLTIA